ncbi:MAG: lysophospholipid acyltransferase family protein [Oceanipulchritudo sp.]
MRTRIFNTAELLSTPLEKALYRPFQWIVEGLFGFPQMRSKYARASGRRMPAHLLCANALRLLKTRWHMDPAEWDRLKAVKGPLVIVANHPFGGVDSLVLIELMHRLRSGQWKLMSNQMLQSVAPLAPYLIAVDALELAGNGQSISQSAMSEILKSLGEDQIIGLFPARRVSHWSRSLNSVVDQPWSQHALKLAARTGATVACLHFPGQNSDTFLRVPLKWQRLRGLMLCREIVKAPARNLEISVAALLSPVDVARLQADPKGVSKLRARCFLEADKRGYQAIQLPEASSLPTPKAPASSTARAQPLHIPDSFHLSSRDGFQLLLFKGEESPELMEALGRCREETFQYSGQGVDREGVVTPGDQWYHQLVVWDPQQNRIAGAYRIGIVSQVLPEKGTKGFYLDHVFNIQPAFYRKLKNGLELSRSFVSPEYQRDHRVFSLLWKGLASIAQRYEADTFYGSVTISNEYNPASRAILVDYLRTHYSDNPEICSLVSARNPFIPQARYHSLVSEAWSGERISVLEPLIRHLEDDQRGIPPLIRYYNSLRARFIAFHVEKDFQETLYCLLRVSLATIPESYLRRFR